MNVKNTFPPLVFDYISRILVVLAGVVMGLGTYQFQSIIRRIDWIEAETHAQDSRLIRIEETYMPAKTLLPLFQEAAVVRTQLKENQTTLMENQKHLLSEVSAIRNELMNLTRQIPRSTPRKPESGTP